uniref:DUF485 domain-containing protein n=1 Tax=Thermodesulfovibrio aggregans TaxID=86166 RepID=A0A7C4AJJ2_9BACT
MKEKIINSAEFKALVKAKKTISLTLASIELLIYFGFIWLIAYEKEFITKKILGNINLGIVMGIGVILLSWILTGIYVIWVNKIYDERMTAIKKKLEEGEI